MGPERTGYNNITIEIYTSGSTRFADPAGVLRKAQNVTFSTVYPGGIFTACQFFIPHDFKAYHGLPFAKRLTIRNGTQTVWEGYIAEITRVVSPSGMGLRVLAVGYNTILFTRYKYNRWLDRRYSARTRGVWDVEDQYQNDKCTFNKTGRLRLEPKQEAWATNEVAAIRYYTNASSNVKRISFDYDFQEGAQAWEFQLWDAGNGTSLWSVTASGTGSQDITLSTSSSDLELRLYSRANQTPTGSPIYGEITNVLVYAENAVGATTSTPHAIISSSVAYIGSPISTDTSLIASNLYDLNSSGIVQDDLRESIGQFLHRVGQYNASDQEYSIGVKEADAVGGTDPVLYYEAVPDLTDYEYTVSIAGDTLAGELSISESAAPDQLKTDVYVIFTDTRGREDWDFSASDATASSTYLGRTKVITAGPGVTTIAAAADFGGVELKKIKNVKSLVQSPVVLQGYVRGKSGDRVPVSNVRAGQRVRFEDFPEDFGDETDTGWTFLIRQTDYDDASETVRLTLGDPMDIGSVIVRESEAGRRLRNL